MKLSEKLWSDLKTDGERASWLRMGRGYETGVVAIAIQQELAMAYERLSGYRNAIVEEREAAALVAAEKEKQIIDILRRLQERNDSHNYYAYAINVIKGETHENPYLYTEQEVSNEESN